MHVDATPSAAVETASAPDVPSFEMLKNTLTTSTFNGIPNKFMMTPRCESGTYLDRSVPMLGKYIPTHASNAKKLAMRAASMDGADSRVAEEETAHVAVPMARVAMHSMADVNCSVETRDESFAK